MFPRGIFLCTAVACLVSVSFEVTAAAWYVDAWVKTSGNGMAGETEKNKADTMALQQP